MHAAFGVNRARFISKMACVACCAISGVSGCAADDGETLSSHQQAIVGGITADDATYDAVVALVASIGEQELVFCSGTLISPDTVLTAAHCVTGDDTLDIPKLMDADLVRIVVGARVGEKTSFSHAIADVRVHPDYVVNGRHDDIAIIRLFEPLDVAPWALSQVPVTQDLTVKMAGFGTDENDVFGVRRVVEGKIDAVCERAYGQCETYVEDQQLFVPNHASLHLYRDGGTCYGDSGGPVFVDAHGGRQIVGVHARVDGACRMYSLSTSVLPYYPWIEAAWETSDGGCSVSWRKQRGGYLAYILAGIAFLCLKRLRKIRHGVSVAQSER